MRFLFFRQFVNRDIRAAGRQAAEAVAEAHPEFRIDGTSLRAATEDHFVFAVFFTDFGRLQKPTPYLLATIIRESSEIKIIKPTPDSPYWIRGYK